MPPQCSKPFANREGSPIETLGWYPSVFVTRAADENLALKHDKYLFGNGIDIYTAPEHYNSVINGRFFLFATMDAAGREITDDVMDRERLEAVRTFMGRKLLTVLLYKWKDPERVREQMNRALAYNIFAAPNRFFEDKISYLESPDGFARDRKLLTWFSEKARMLYDAGWQPVTHAVVDDPEIACERYGTGGVSYFTVGNLTEETRECELVIDMEALNISRGSEERSTFSEVSRDGPIRAKIGNKEGQVRMTIPPNDTWIIKLARTWQ